MVTSPLIEGAARGYRSLAEDQRAIVLGETIPIVFGRRVGDIGGVFVSPGATEGRYENDYETNDLTVNLQLVLSEGELPPLQIRDVYQRACRVGTWYQTYNQRAGTWTPGNFIGPAIGTTGWICPYYCGTSGKYYNLTTLSYENSFMAPDSGWKYQVHCFVREGMQVTRILDNTYGPSNNVIDLALYLIRQSSRFPEDLIDLDAMEAAATFTNYNELYYNGEFKDSTNLEDWLQSISTSFLLRVSDSNGKKGFRPRLPTNENGSISTDPVSWVFGFTEDHILPDGFQIEYIPLADRKPICAQVIWRQQPDDDIGIIRTTEVRFNNYAQNGPFEQYDLSQFCASENHAIKVGMYYIARRIYVRHTLRLKVRPDVYNGSLTLGDIVRVQLRRETNAAGVSLHDYLYEVERINRSVTGTVELDLVHFPIDSLGRSIVALYVNDAEGANYAMPTGREDFSCDVFGRASDDSPLEDEGGNLPGLPADDNFTYDPVDDGTIYPQPLPNTNTGLDPLDPFRDIGYPDDGITNPVDPLDEPVGAIITGEAVFGGTLNVVPPCPDGRVDWFRKNKTTGTRELIKSEPLGPGWQNGSSLEITTSEIDYVLEAYACCPDSGNPDGFSCSPAEEWDLTVGASGKYYNPRIGGVFNPVYSVNGVPTQCGWTSVSFSSDRPVQITTEPGWNTSEANPRVSGYAIVTNEDGTTTKICICPSLFDPPQSCNTVSQNVGTFVMYYLPPGGEGGFQLIQPDFTVP
jgi:hypothetical protein